MPNKLRILIVEDSLDDTFLIVRELQRAGSHVDFERVETSAAMQAALDEHTWDLIISDYKMPLFDGHAALALYQKKGLDVPFIIVSGAIGEDAAVEMLKDGAHNFVTKDHLSRLAPAVEQEVLAARQRRIRAQTEATSTYLASLVQSCNDAIIGLTLDAKVVSWNAGAEQLYGYTAAEMIGRSAEVLMPPYRPKELPEILERLARGENVERFETVRLRKGGEPVEVSLTISPVKDASGRVIGTASVGRDITQRKRDENERLNLIQDLTAALGRVNALSERP
jgi:PAS domain S-box-containing protein